MNKHKVAIVGSGPAGLSAAIYLSRADIATTVYAGEEPGGQLTKTTEIENYPGVVGKTGPELMTEMTQQAQKFGTEIVYETIDDLTKLKDEFDGVILAMGASSRLLGVGEERYWGKGFSTCAVCDAAFYRGKNVYVVGGGDAAVEDAMALTKFASSVTMLVRGTEFRASKIMQKRVLENSDKIKVIWKANLKEIRGDRVEELVIEIDGKEEIVKAEGLFFAIGHIPATGFLRDIPGMLDENGYVLIQSQNAKAPNLQVGMWPTMTIMEGVFAGGDCVDHRYRQAATAVGMGVAAALDCERWLEGR